MTYHLCNDQHRNESQVTISWSWAFVWSVSTCTQRLRPRRLPKSLHSCWICKNRWPTMNCCPQSFRAFSVPVQTRWSSGHNLSSLLMYNKSIPRCYLTTKDQPFQWILVELNKCVVWKSSWNLPFLGEGWIWPFSIIAFASRLSRREARFSSSDTGLGLGLFCSTLKFQSKYLKGRVNKHTRFWACLHYLLFPLQWLKHGARPSIWDR